MAKTNKNMDKKLKKMLKKLKYDIELGTPEMPNGYPARLYSVDDAAAMLVDLLMDPAIIEDNERAYANKTKLGDLHVYDDGRPIRFNINGLKTINVLVLIEWQLLKLTKGLLLLNSISKI